MLLVIHSNLNSKTDQAALAEKNTKKYGKYKNSAQVMTK